MVFSQVMNLSKLHYIFIIINLLLPEFRVNFSRITSRQVFNVENVKSFFYEKYTKKEVSATFFTLYFKYQC